MEKIGFSEAVVKNLGHYVYRLIDPRNGATFYVGRGHGNRIFDHARGVYADLDRDENRDNESLKINKIRQIIFDGFSVQYIVHRHGMDEKTAREVEAALIDAYDSLANIQSGYHGDRGVMNVDQVIKLYEAEEANFRHKIILINVNKSTDNAEPSDLGLYNAVRYSWKITPAKAKQYDYVFAVRKGLIIGVFEPKEWLPATTEYFPSFTPVNGRYGFNGDKASQEIEREYLHKRIPNEHRKRGASNPIRYIDV